MKLLRYLWRNLRWFILTLWEGKKVPRILEGPLYSRKVMRRAWKPRLQALDRAYNLTRDVHLLWDRRIMVAKRRACRFV
jgi:hypothetical protein